VEKHNTAPNQMCGYVLWNAHNGIDSFTMLVSLCIDNCIKRGSKPESSHMKVWSVISCECLCLTILMHMSSQPDGWFVSRLFGWLVSWLAGSEVGWGDCWEDGWLAELERRAGRLVWETFWFVNFKRQLVGWSVCCTVGLLPGWLVGW
jgi:hypothetical protein